MTVLQNMMHCCKLDNLTLYEVVKISITATAVGQGALLRRYIQLTLHTHIYFSKDLNEGLLLGVGYFYSVVSILQLKNRNMLFCYSIMSVNTL